MPLHTRHLYAELRGCDDKQGILLVQRGSFQVWVRHYRDRAGNWQPHSQARLHQRSVALWLFDNGLVRMEGKRLVLIQGPASGS